MRMLLVPAVVGLALAGCTTLGSIDTSIQSSLNSICPKYQQADAAYSLARLFFSVPPEIEAKVDYAHTVLGPLCENPSQATTASVLAKAAEALATIKAATPAK